MGKIRIYELAKELKQDSKTIISELEKKKIPVKNHMSTISDEVARDIKEKFSQKMKKESGQQRTEQGKQGVKQKKETSEKSVAKNTHKNKGAKSNQNKNAVPVKTGNKSDTQMSKKNANSENRTNRDQKTPASSKNAGARKNNDERPRNKSGQQDGLQNKSNGHQKRHRKDQKSHDAGFDSHQNNGHRGNRTNRSNKKKNRRSKQTLQPVKEPREFAEVQYHVVVTETITVQELARQLGKKASEVIMKLMTLGVMATMNQELDADTASIIAEEYGATIEIKKTMEENLMAEMDIEDKEEDLKKRPSVVTIMGHVDHGKTSLLDRIRETNVISTEAGGITQQIGAYQVEVNGEKITFLDTPGHEAFTSMRARGAQITDIAILVVAADDGVMPQTIEAIDHAKAAEVPVIVAINKIDKPDANPEQIKQELTQYGLISEDWGGDVIMVPVSAKQGIGIEELLEMVLLVAEMQDLRANPDRSAKGKVIESKLDKSRGATATLLVQNGTLRSGDFLIVGSVQGRIRAMFDHRGRAVELAEPSMPVEILGLNDVPEAGDDFLVVDNERLAKQIAEKRQQEKHEKEISRGGMVSLEDLFTQIKDGNVRELNLVLKADTQGSIEAMRQSLANLGTDEVRVNIIRTAVGGIRETDVMLAAASHAIIIGFNVRPDVNAKRLAETESVDIKTYRIIYEAIDDVKNALSGLLAPEIKEVDLGQAEVRSVFKVPKVGNIAGCYVIDGKIQRNAKVRLLRDGVVIHEGELSSLKRFKDDVKEVATGYECGVGLEKFNDLKEGDVIEAYTFQEIKRELY